MIRLLLRPLAFILAIWLVCYLFYSLGKRKAVESARRRQSRQNNKKRKYVQSTPIENGETDDKSKNQ